MATPAQNYANHGRYVPLFHFVLGGILVANLAASGRRLYLDPGMGSAMDFALAIGLGIMGWYTRAFALAAQDRVIRLEMRLRLEKLLPAGQFAQFNRLAPAQLVALRFAGDQEMPALVAEVLDGKLSDPDAIKKRIQDWQPDWMRV